MLEYVLSNSFVAASFALWGVMIAGGLCVCAIALVERAGLRKKR
jgi:hypothetical protein